MRLLTASGLSRIGSLARTDPMPRWICEELLSSLPHTYQQTIHDACSLSSSFPALTLSDICLAMALPADAWVLHTPTGLVFRICLITPAPPPSAPTYHLNNGMSISPDSRLVPVDPSIAIPSATGPVSAHLLRLVHVWPTTRLAHSDEQRSYEDRNPGTARTVWLYGGPAIHRSLLFDETTAPPPCATPSPLGLYFPPCDRSLSPLTLPTIDVYSLYHLQLLYQRTIPRTLDPSRPTTNTSTHLAHLLQVPGHTAEAVRTSMCRASHPSPDVGFPAAHSLYMTLLDARPIGNERCRKRGPTRTLCDICWHIDRSPNSELSSHVLIDCPYSRLVTDPILRSLLASYSSSPEERDSWLTAHPSTITNACERLLHSGSSLGLPVTVPPPVAASVAGSISIALFARAAMNAPPTPQPLPLPRPALSSSTLALPTPTLFASSHAALPTPTAVLFPSTTVLLSSTQVSRSGSPRMAQLPTGIRHGPHSLSRSPTMLPPSAPLAPLASPSTISLPTPALL